MEGVTGWSVGQGSAPETDPGNEVDAIYNKLESQILPLNYRRPEDWTRVTRSTISPNGSFFHAGRMLIQCLENAYRSASAL